MADERNPKQAPIDPCKHINVVLNADGSLTRPTDRIPNVQPSSNDPHSVISLDIPLNHSKKTSMRVFQPPNISSDQKLPLIIYFHGGGFVLYSPSAKPFHDFCVKMARVLPAIIVSVDYRLSPEHKLPAAYEDAEDALLWVKSQALKAEFNSCKFVDFGRCFVMGTSSGGNIAYHAGLKALGLNLGPVRIIGLIMNQPYFGGIRRTGTELELEFDKVIPLALCDWMWELSLPGGADRDHEYCNPMTGSSHDAIKHLPKCFVRVYGGDPLADRQMEFVKMLQEHGVSVAKYFIEDGSHGCEFSHPEEALALLVDARNFIYSSQTAGAATGSTL